MNEPKQAKQMANIPELVGIGKFGSTTATAVARQAATDGMLKGQVSASKSIMHG